MFYSVFFVVFAYFITLAGAAFECPSSHITKEDGLTGVLPAGAKYKTQVPQGTNCTYTFEIPRGFALKMTTSTEYWSSRGDFIKFDNFYITTTAYNAIEYSVNEQLPYQVVSATGDLKFIATYTFMDLTNYQQVLKPTGTYFNTTLAERKYYTVKASAENDQVHLTYGSLTSPFGDGTIYQVFLFDGPDIMNSKYMGRVTEAFDQQKEFYSSNNTLTLLNLYGKPSHSLFLGNDASVVKTLDYYDVYVIDSKTHFDDWMGLDKMPEFIPDAWHTIICNDCDSFSIDLMTFDDKYMSALGYAEVQGMTPTHRLPALLNYPFSLSNNNSFPQLIPAPMATFHLHNAIFEIHLSSGENTFDAAPGKTQSVCSPQLWDPNAAPSFDYTFSDPSSSQLDFLAMAGGSPQVFNFSIDLQTIDLENDGDELDVQIGYLNGVTPLKKKYTKTKFSNQYISGFGEFLKLKYTGNTTSKVILNFEMLDPPPKLTTTTQSTSTIQQDVTTRPIPVKTVSTRTSRAITTTTAAITSAKSSSTAPTVPTTTTEVPMTSHSTVVTSKLTSSSMIPVTSPSTTKIISTPTVSSTLHSTSSTSLLPITTTYDPTTPTTTAPTTTLISQLETNSTSKSTSNITTSIVTSPTTQTSSQLFSTTPNLTTQLSSSTAQSTQKTTIAHVETTTRSASSLNYTGLLILVISILIL